MACGKVIQNLIPKGLLCERSLMQAGKATAPVRIANLKNFGQKIIKGTELGTFAGVTFTRRYEVGVKKNGKRSDTGDYNKEDWV